MEIKEFGKRSGKSVMLLHGNLMSWRQFEDIIPLLESEFHVIALSFDGFDGTGNTTYTSAEEQTDKLAVFIKENLSGELDCLFAESLGCGPAIILRNRTDLTIGSMVLSGAEYMDFGLLNDLLLKIMPKKQLKISTNLHTEGFRMPTYALRMMGQTEESLAKMARAIPFNISLDSIRTTWKVGLYLYRQAEKFSPIPNATVSCWYGEKESNMKKAIAVLKRLYPKLEIHCFNGYGHGEIINHPEQLVHDLKKFMER